VQLRNGWSEELELSTLLVRIQTKSLVDEDPVLYEDIQHLRHKERDLTRQKDELEQAGNDVAARQIEEDLQQTAKELEQKSEERQRKSNVQGPRKRPVKKVTSLSSVASSLSERFSSSLSFSGSSG